MSAVAPGKGFSLVTSSSLVLLAFTVGRGVEVPGPISGEGLLPRPGLVKQQGLAREVLY